MRVGRKYSGLIVLEKEKNRQQERVYVSKQGRPLKPITLLEICCLREL